MQLTISSNSSWIVKLKPPFNYIFFAQQYLCDWGDEDHESVIGVWFPITPPASPADIAWSAGAERMPTGSP